MALRIVFSHFGCDLFRDDEYTVDIAEHDIPVVDRDLPDLNGAAPLEHVGAHRGILRPGAGAENREVLLDHFRRIAGVAVQHSAHRAARLAAGSQQFTPQGAVVRAGGNINFVGLQIVQRFGHIAERLLRLVLVHVIFQHSAGVTGQLQPLVLSLAGQNIRRGGHLGG